MYSTQFDSLLKLFRFKRLRSDMRFDWKFLQFSLKKKIQIVTNQLFAYQHKTECVDCQNIYASDAVYWRNCAVL